MLEKASVNEREERPSAGFSLPQRWYTSESVYQQDLQSVWAYNWLWVGHTSQISQVGDYIVFDIGPESVVIVRDSDSSVRAHMNLCRHRGSRVCLERTGSTRLFTCPYHAWTYALDGSLTGGRQMPDDFDVSRYGLLPVRLLEYQGLLFISLAENPPPIASALPRLARFTDAFDFCNMKVAHEARYTVPANWKLALENYLECYHCAPSHRAYSRSHSLKDPDSMTPALIEAMESRSRQAGLLCGTLSETADDAVSLGCDLYYRRYPLYDGFVTGSETGKPLAPMLGKLSGYDSGASDVTIGPLNHFLAYTDHVVGYRFLPRGVSETEMQVVWMVRADAQEDHDYQRAALTWLWDVTTRDDERIIRHNQEGVNSAFYQPGPLSDMEWGISEFHQNYFAMLDL